MRHFHRLGGIVLAIILTLSSVSVFSQTGDGTPMQRLEVMRQRLETIRRSAASSLTGLREDSRDTRADRDNPDSAAARLRSIEREASSMQNQVNNLRGRLDRAEKYEMADIDQLEVAVADLQARADRVFLETAEERSQAEVTEGRPREPQKRRKFLGIFGRGGSDEFDELLGSVRPGRDRELFIVATREIRKRNYDVGRLLFQTIVTTYPDSPYLPMAKLAIADSFYLEGSTSALIQAISAYQDWLTFFPTHALADRVVLKVAESEMRQIGLPDRDPTRARRAEVRLKALIANYPNTVLKKDAELRLAEVQNNLGTHNLIVANYYYNLSIDQKKGGLKGAQSRYMEIIEKYPNFGNMDEVLYKLAVTYMVEEETDQAARYFAQIVADYPNSTFVERSKDQLELIGATVPMPNPDRMNVIPPQSESFFRNFRNQLFGIYPMTIDRDGVLMTKNFDREKFELIDQIIENQGDLYSNQIPQSLTTVISQRQPAAGPQSQAPEER